MTFSHGRQNASLCGERLKIANNFGHKIKSVKMSVINVV